MATKTRHVGLHGHRLADNPEEARFAEAWATENDRYRPGDSLLGWLLHTGDQSGSGHAEPTDRECEVAATVVQWLGSPVGQHFLEGLGYHK